MAGIILEINVDDRGSVKIKQFSDETKKAFKEMKKGPDEAKKSLGGLQEAWIGVTAKVGIAVGAFYAAKRLIYDTAVQIASATNDIERQAAVLGIGTDEFQKWQYAAKMADVNSQELAIGMKMLSRNMEDAAQGSGDAAKYLSVMGISIKTTEGHLRPLNDMMGDIMDKFASWEDGPRKIAIAMQLFGRSGETLIPLLNKGRAGFQELAAEAQKLGQILSPELVKKGGEAEDAFKRISVQWQATKNSFAGAAKGIAEAWEPVLAIINLINAGIGKVREFSDSIEKRKWKTGIGSLQYEKQLDQAEMLRETAEYYRNIEKIKIPPPAIAAKKEVDAIKEIETAWESLNRVAAEYGEVAIARAELAERGWSKEKDIVTQVREELERLKRETNEWGEITVVKLELIETGWKEIAAIEEVVRKAAGVRTDQAVQEIEKLTQSQEAWVSLSKNILSAWNFNVTGILRGTEKIGDAFKNMVDGMVDAFISGVSKMIMEWLLFESIQGGGKKFLGKGSGIGSIVGWIGKLLSLQEGGTFLAKKPTLLMVGEGSEDELVDVTPKSKMGKIPIEAGREGTVVINYVQVTDPNTFVNTYGPVVKKLSEASIIEAKKMGAAWTRG